MPDNPELVVLMLQQRNMAQMIERQLTHRAAARSVSGLAAVLAHEIKNPLSGIRGAAQLLEQGLTDADRSLTQLICSETDRIRNLVDRMEVFGDERPLVKEPVNIHDVLDHVRRLCETGFGRGIRFIEDYDPSLPPVAGNRDKLVQAILNLVKNAVEAMPGGGRIEIANRGHVVRERRLFVELVVADTGPGLAPGVLANLFSEVKSAKEGRHHGLGLSIVHGLVQKLNGLIACRSGRDGTTFEILLPAPRSNPPAVALPAHGTDTKTDAM
jgi:two-component system nitrogen regulation sensor histidine kinase GlnL